MNDQEKHNALRAGSSTICRSYPGNIFQSHHGEIPCWGLRSRILQGTAGQLSVQVIYQVRIGVKVLMFSKLRHDCPRQLGVLDLY